MSRIWALISERECDILVFFIYKVFHPVCIKICCHIWYCFECFVMSHIREDYFYKKIDKLSELQTLPNRLLYLVSMWDEWELLRTRDAEVMDYLIHMEVIRHFRNTLFIKFRDSHNPFYKRKWNEETYEDCHIKKVKKQKPISLYRNYVRNNISVRYMRETVFWLFGTLASGYFIVSSSVFISFEVACTVLLALTKTSIYQLQHIANIFSLFLSVIQYYTIKENTLH